MSAYQLTLDLPEALYQQFAAQAQAETRNIHELVVDKLLHYAVPPIEHDLPPALQIELKAMESLSEDALWAIARSTMNPDKVALYDVLLERHQEGLLTPAGRDWLNTLRQEADFLMLRKAHAYVLLKSRGHSLPTLTELRFSNVQ